MQFQQTLLVAGDEVKLLSLRLTLVSYCNEEIQSVISLYHSLGGGAY
ncbi:MAG: hypothetical protein SOR57_12995 [Parabacteroides sp.]|nr:hypothetical protein [Parabacteroides sp.]